MKQSKVLFSTTGILLSLVLLVGLGFTLIRSGGLAFSPGPLTAKGSGAELGGYTEHASFENDCSRCHQPLKTIQAPLCIECHSSVGDEIAQKVGIHGVIDNSQQCSSCHPDHRGRDFDSAAAALSQFNHSRTRFSLVRHQVDYDATPLDCQACHTMAQSSFPARLDRCNDCHAQKDPLLMTKHQANFGSACLDCHDGKDSTADFDHSQSKFTLEGQHARLICEQCHTQADFKATPATCAGCHAEPAEHKGVFESDCQTCHTTTAWKPAQLSGKQFDHNQASFALSLHQVDYQEQRITCTGCHTASIQQADSQACITCHAGHDQPLIDKHLSQYGAECLQCHDGVDRMQGFDHAAAFPLEGKHTDVACEKCHTDHSFRNTPAACFACHPEPDIHAGFFGTQCEYCHTASAWTPALLKSHNFPLDHGRQAASDCKECHPDKYAEYTCYNCHEHEQQKIAKKHTEEGISAAQLPDCVKCHPTGKEGGD